MNEEENTQKVEHEVTTLEAEPGNKVEEPNTDEPKPEELSVSFGDTEEGEEVDKPDDREWVKDLRRRHREDKKRIRQLEEKLNSTVKEEPPLVKPTLEQFNYDSQAYEAELLNWAAKRQKQEEQEEQRKREAQERDKQWQDRLGNYSAARESLKVSDFEDAEEVVSEVLNITQQGIIIQGADNPALLIYALGKNPRKAAELAKITDPIKFTFEVAKLEKQLKTTPKTPTTPPEKTLRGTKSSGVGDTKLEALRTEAERTGDYTKVRQYRTAQRAARN